MPSAWQLFTLRQSWHTYQSCPVPQDKRSRLSMQCWSMSERISSTRKRADAQVVNKKDLPYSKGDLRSGYALVPLEMNSTLRLIPKSFRQSFQRTERRIAGTVFKTVDVCLSNTSYYCELLCVRSRAGRKILCKRFSTKSRMALENRADSGLDPLITESHGGQSGMRAGTA